MTTPPPTSRSAPPGLLRSPGFDLALVGGSLLLALLAGVVVVRWPQLFALVLLADLWLLSYHHVIATFTRLAFDRASFREHRFLVLGVPVLVVVATFTAVKLFGLWVVPTVYFYWQWWHYTRQSYGLSRIYQLKAQRPGKDRLGNAMLSLVALLGVLHRSAQRWPRFLGAQVRMLPVPPALVYVTGAAAAVVVVLWLVREVGRARAGQPGRLQALYLGSHALLFGVAYLGIDDLDVGWLVVNVWHNAQYLLLVWHFNNNRFRDGVSPTHRFLSWISQAQRWPIYIAVCLAVTSALYGGLAAATAAFASSALPALVIAYQVINFHHYLADAVIWKVRRKPVQEALGIAA
jgi:hypothetical protein